MPTIHMPYKQQEAGILVGVTLVYWKVQLFDTAWHCVTIVYDT